MTEKVFESGILKDIKTHEFEKCLFALIIWTDHQENIEKESLKGAFPHSGLVVLRSTYP